MTEAGRSRTHRCHLSLTLNTPESHPDSSNRLERNRGNVEKLIPRYDRSRAEAEEAGQKPEEGTVSPDTQIDLRETQRPGG